MSDLTELVNAADELLTALRARETPYVATARNARPEHEVSAAKAARVTQARQRLKTALDSFDHSRKGTG